MRPSDLHREPFVLHAGNPALIYRLIKANSSRDGDAKPEVSTSEMAQLPVDLRRPMVFSSQSRLKSHPLAALPSSRVRTATTRPSRPGSLLGAVCDRRRPRCVTSGACNESALTQPFATVGRLEPLRVGSRRRLRGHVVTVDPQRAAPHQTPGSEPYGCGGHARATSHSRSPAGASAQSPYTCVNASYPTFRFFARNDGAALDVLVQVVYKTAPRARCTAVGNGGAEQQLEPTLPMLTGSVVGGLLSGGTAQVALRFTALIGELPGRRHLHRPAHALGPIEAGPSKVEPGLGPAGVGRAGRSGDWPALV